MADDIYETVEMELTNCSTPGGTHKSTKNCSVCNESLCNTCTLREQQQQEQHGLMNHQYTYINVNGDKSSTLEQATQSLSMCDTHKMKDIVFYCGTHQAICCDDCKTFTHVACHIKGIKERATEQDQSSLLIEKIQLISNLNRKLDQIKWKREHDVEILDDSKEKRLAEVKDLKRDIDDLFVELEQEIIDDIVKMDREIRARIERQMVETGKMMRRLSEIKVILQRCQASNEDTLMCIGVEKSAKEIADIEKLVNEMKGERPEIVDFRVNPSLTQLTNSLKNLGKVMSNIELNVSDAQVTSQRTLRVKSTCITGSTFLEGGELVLCDNARSKIILFNPDLTTKKTLRISDPPRDVAAINPQQVIVTQPESWQLQYVDVFPRLRKTKTIKLGMRCWGITSGGGKIYVVVGEPEQREILVLGLDGGSFGHINLANRGMSRPLYVTANSSGKLVCVSDYRTGIVSCMEESGSERFRYNSDYLMDPRGMMMDDHNNLLVCDWGSNNVTVVKEDGTLRRIMLTGSEGLQGPQTVSYRSQDRTLVVGMNNPGSCCEVFTVL